LILLPTLAGAITIHVPADQPTIQAGIDAAEAGDTVLVACGIYYEHDVVLKSGVVLRSETGEADCVTIDAQQQSRALYGENLDEFTAVEGFTITGGFADEIDYLGGGLYCTESILRVASCLFIANEAHYRGGGAYCDDSSGSFVDCEFRENVGGTSGGGGGMGSNSRMSLSPTASSWTTRVSTARASSATAPRRKSQAPSSRVTTPCSSAGRSPVTSKHLR